MRFIFRLVSAALVIFVAAACWHEGGGPLERIARLGSWEKKETAYRDIVNSSYDKILVSRAAYSLVQGYLEQGRRADAEIYYGKLKSSAHSAAGETDGAEICGIASKAADMLAESYINSMDFFKASAYIEEEIEFMEYCGENVSDKLLVLIDLYTKTCSYDRALYVFGKWSELYGDAFPELAEATESKLADSMSAGGVSA